jgi:hypothetical protein
VFPVKYELRFYIPEGDILHGHRQENRKSYTILHIDSSVHFFGFHNNDFYYRAKSLALLPTPNLQDKVSVFMSSSDRLVQPPSLTSFPLRLTQRLTGLWLGV